MAGTFSDGISRSSSHLVSHEPAVIRSTGLVTNPVTMPVMFYIAYVVGTWIIGVPATAFHFELTLDWLMTGLSVIWKPFLTGCLVLATISSLIAYGTIQILWRISISKRWALRRQR